MICRYCRSRCCECPEIVLDARAAAQHFLAQLTAQRRFEAAHGAWMLAAYHPAVDVALYGVMAYRKVSGQAGKGVVL